MTRADQAVEVFASDWIEAGGNPTELLEAMARFIVQVRGASKKDS